MVMNGDLGYINPKYRQVSQMLRANYDSLYGVHTIMGRWLRSKNTIVKINKLTFVHGGLSEVFLKDGYDIELVNQTMRDQIDQHKTEETDKTEEENKIDLARYFGDDGPIWYRGYFYDSLKDSEIKKILKQVKSKHIVVGHCSNETVVQLYDQKIFGVDSSMKLGEYGELLMITNQLVQRATLDGTLKDFEPSN